MKLGVRGIWHQNNWQPKPVPVASAAPMILAVAVAFEGRKNPSLQKVQAEIAKVQAGLTPDLLNAEWREKNEASGNPLVGHCYVAAEALFHRLGGRGAGWQSMMLNHSLWPDGCDPGETHWFLKHESGMTADPTAGQYDGKPIAYDRAKPCGFLTRQPSRRAQKVLNHIQQKRLDRLA